MKPGECRIKLLDKQAAFLQSKTRGTIYRAGLGSGKSRILCYKAIENASQRGRRECIVSFSYTTLRDVILHGIKQYLPLFGYTPGQNCTINHTEMRVSFSSGGEILLRSGDNPDALRGLNLHDFFIDEAREFKKADVFDIMIGRIRLTEDAQWFICTTPRGKDWVYKLSLKPGVTLIKQSTMKNKFLPKATLEELKERYTSKFASQELDGNIVDFSGDIIKSSNFKAIPYIRPSQGVRFWDLAVSEKKTADSTAGALCMFSGRLFAVADIEYGQWQYPKTRERIIECAKRDGTGVVIGVEDAGQQRSVIDDLRQCQELRPYTIRALRPRGDKVARAMPWASQSELGNMGIMPGAWNDEFKDQCDAFSADDTHEHDDLIDAVSGSYAMLTNTGTASFVSLPI